MERDSLGRYLTVNSPDVSMYASHQDLWHFAPDDRRTVGFAICLLVLVLTTTTTGMRIYTRLRITRAMGVDDWAMAASQVSLFIYSGIMIPGYLYGTGLHRAQMTFTNAELALRCWYLCFGAYAIATTAVKISLALFLLRFTRASRQRLFLYCAIAACVCVGVGFIIFLSLICDPWSFLWDLNPSDRGAYCYLPLTVRNVSYFVGSMNTTADLFCGIIPALIIRRIPMSRASKAGVWFLLALGSIATIATLVRMAFSVDDTRYKGEFLYETAPLALLTTIELGCCVCAANLATVQPLLKRWGRNLGLRTAPYHARFPSRITRDEARLWEKSIPVGMDVVRPPEPVGRMREFSEGSDEGFEIFARSLAKDPPRVVERVAFEEEEEEVEEREEPGV